MGKRVKLIIADDNRNICQMLQNHLQGQEDLSIVGVVHNGLEAWEFIQTQEPDLIILDLVMPNLDRSSPHHLLPSIQTSLADEPPNASCVPLTYCALSLSRWWLE